MKKSLLLFIPLFVSGCPMGNKVNLRPAKATAVGSKICVFFDKNDMEREESILKVAIWKYGNMGIWEYGNMGIWEYGNMGIWEYGNMGIWEYGNMGIWEYGNMGIWEYGNMEIWEYGNMEIWKYGNMGIWEYGNMGIWEYGNMGIWKYGNMEIWKYGNMEIWKYGNDNYVYEKSYENTPVALEPGKCVPGIGEYDFILGEGRSVIVSTPLHPYEARFIVWKRGEEVVLK